jgi:tRNA(Ile)-lysidine synthase
MNSGADLGKHVGVILRREVSRGAALAVGLSGGIDSVVLLHVLVRRLRLATSRISVIHVNHQISPHAASWAAFCRRLCRELGVSLRVVKVHVPRGNSTEAAARAARYAVFAGSGADALLLAHNRDDQAETLLLQLLRGAGPRGLAAMPVLRAAGAGMLPVLRPLLNVPRKAIAAYAQHHRLQWVEDDSNRDPAYVRNFLRHEVMPALERRLPGTGTTLARAARHQAEASDLLDTLAALDIGASAGQGSLPLALLKVLVPPRARNALRYFLRCSGIVMPEAERLEELLRQAVTARSDARVCVDLGGIELRRFREVLYIVRPLPRQAKTFEVLWSGQGLLPLPQLGGSLKLEQCSGKGIAASALSSKRLLVKARQAGETLRPAAGGRQRTVRNLLQEAALPPWQRERLPFLYLDGELAAVPGLGIDAKFQAGPGRPGLLPVWVPD